jgi:hypothetical protein
MPTDARATCGTAPFVYGASLTPWPPGGGAGGCFTSCADFLPGGRGLMTGSMLIGSYVLDFFGISLWQRQ